MNKDFLMGAELAMRGAGIQDERVKQRLLAQVTNQKIAEAAEQMKKDEQFRNYTTNFFNTTGKANQLGADYAPPAMSPEGMVGKPDMNQYLQGLMPFLSAPQSASTIASLAGQQNQSEMNRERIKAAYDQLVARMESNQKIADVKSESAQKIAEVRGQDKPTDFEKGYREWATKPENKGKPREEYRRVWEKPTDERINKMNLAAIAAGVHPDKAAKGELTPEEAKAVLEAYGKGNGMLELIQLLMEAGGNKASNDFDAQGNRIKK